MFKGIYREINMSDLSCFDGLNWGEIEQNKMRVLQKKKDVVEGKIKAAESAGVALNKSLLDQLKPIDDQIKKLQQFIDIGDSGQKVLREESKTEENFKKELRIEQEEDNKSSS